MTNFLLLLLHFAVAAQKARLSLLGPHPLRGDQLTTFFLFLFQGDGRKQGEKGNRIPLNPFYYYFPRFFPRF